MMEQTSWYVVYTAFRAEKRVKERLDEAGIANYLPLRVVEREGHDGVRKVEVPLISGCVFVHVSETDVAGVLSTSGIVTLERERDGIAVLSDRQVESLRVLNDRGGEVEVIDLLTGWQLFLK